MRCPKCQSTEVRIGEMFEILYEANENGTPGEILNDADLFAGPEDYYFCCADCWSRWDMEGHLLGGVASVPDRI